jgi:hypothetical protein
MSQLVGCIKSEIPHRINLTAYRSATIFGLSSRQCTVTQHQSSSSGLTTRTVVIPLGYALY